MTTDLMLRFPDEAAAIAALPMLRGEDGWLTASHHHALDIIGPVSGLPVMEPTGAMVEETFYDYEADELTTQLVPEMREVAPATVDERFHANLRLLPGADPAIAAAAEPFAVSPADPARVWA